MRPNRIGASSLQPLFYRMYALLFATHASKPSQLWREWGASSQSSYAFRDETSTTINRQAYVYQQFCNAFAAAAAASAAAVAAEATTSGEWRRVWRITVLVALRVRRKTTVRVSGCGSCCWVMGWILALAIGLGQGAVGHASPPHAVETNADDDSIRECWATTRQYSARRSICKCGRDIPYDSEPSAVDCESLTDWTERTATVASLWESERASWHGLSQQLVFDGWANAYATVAYCWLRVHVMTECKYTQKKRRIYRRCLNFNRFAYLLTYIVVCSTGIVCWALVWALICDT
jgi:hypothetical protein